MLAFVLDYAETRETRFIEFDLCVWARTPWEQFPAREFFQQAETASVVTCPSCRSRHRSEVVLWRNPDGSCRQVIPCPESLYVEIRPEQLRQWTINFNALANAVAAALSLGGRCTDLVPGRLWRLGRTNWQGASRDVMFARGLGWDDASTVRAEIVRARKPIVFVAQCLPPEDLWLGRVPPVLALSQFTTLCDGQLEIEALAIASAVQDADAAGSPAGITTVTEEQMKLMIRQQIKAENKMELRDDLLIAAYRHCGTYRAAGEYLSQETEQEVSKDAVYRAVRRGGGVLAVLNSEDSNSVVRRVLSQRCDKKGKLIPQAQPT